MAARAIVVPTASATVPSAISSPSRSSTVNGDGRMYSGRHPDHTTACHRNSASAMAASFGHVASQIRRPRSGRRARRGAASMTVALSSSTTGS